MDITTSILSVVISLILTFCLYNWLFTTWDYWTSRGIPSLPGHVPIFGNILSVFRLQDNFPIFCKKVYEAYRGKSMVGFYSLKTPVLMVRDPELVKTVLQTDFNNFNANAFKVNPVADPLLGLDPLFLNGHAWKKARANIVSALSARRIKLMASVIEEVCKRLDNHLEEKLKNKDYFEIDAKFLFSRYAADVAAGSVFGIEGNSFADDYKGTLLDVLKMTLDPAKHKALGHNIVLLMPGLNYFMKNSIVPVEANKLFREIVNDVDDLRKKNNVETIDVLQLMLEMEKNGELSRRETLAHMFSFCLESFESSSLTLSSMAYFIARDQQVQNRLREEVESVLAKHNGKLTFEAISEMSYLEQAMVEALRFFPITGISPKVCTKSSRLEGHDGLAVDLNPGNLVLIPSWGLGMDPEFWKNPEEFNPDRFAKENVAARHKYVHLPFSSGPRTCPGRRHGTVQVKAAIATILRNYRMESSSKMQQLVGADPYHFLVISAGGYWIRLRRLEKN